MIEVYKNIYIGTDNHCTFQHVDDLAIIHACKHPCHVNAIGYKGNLPNYHPNYLVAEINNHLVLNIVDMEKELHPTFTNPIMASAIHFMEKHVLDRKVLVHCNQGQSRSPSIVLIYLARIRVVDSSSFSSAVKDFLKLYKYYSPGKGIAMYLNRNWEYLMKEL